ncbi:MAG: primosomal protein N' [Erysipelotrichaceae bacterium]|nr:primosomal protein N' [Erysipelotrichaceae bacterium]
MLVANIWIEHPILKIDKTFSYLADGFILSKGIRVKVSFNKQTLIGFVDEVVDSHLTLDQFEKVNGFCLKPIVEVIDEKTLITDELYDLGKWMAHHTISPHIACYQTMLPAKLNIRSSSKKIKYEEYAHYIHDNVNMTIKQKAALTSLKTKDVLLAKLRKEHGYGVVKALLDKECISIYQIEARYKPRLNDELSEHQVLTADQKNAYDQINDSEKDIILLHGATGSGKTEIYLHLAQDAIDLGKQVLILVPEIALTPQMVERVSSRFGDQVAIYHSALNDQEKYEQFKRVEEQNVAVVVGTRSAAFMPFKRLGLIVMDEEHDHSYKQDRKPCYHCRDVVIKRAQYHRCKVVLGSATPSLESYARALKGVYQLVELPKRINDQALPKCHVIDIRPYLKQGIKTILTPPIQSAIKDRLALQQQVILLLNRRGYTPIQQCLDCDHVMTCPDCDVAMNYHKDIDHLVCHTCGKMIRADHVCPICGGRQWLSMGYGTQKLEEELYRTYKGVRVLRMDADTTSYKHAHKRILDDFGAHKADILVGTQMIAKGLDYPLVTLVGVLSADATLARDDFRAVETTFDLIVQASGRSGRGIDVGEVMIQAFDPNHYAIKAASNHDYKRFYAHEMQYRHAGGYPPYTFLISIIFSANNLDILNKAVYDLADQIKVDRSLKVLGPSPLYKIFKRQRLRLVIKGKDLGSMIVSVKNYIDHFIDINHNIDVLIDVDPSRLD